MPFLHFWRHARSGLPLLLAPPLALAEGTVGGTSPLGVGSLLQSLLGLLAVLALLLAATYWLRRIQGQQGIGGGLMRVVAALPLGARERIIIVEVEETWLVLGITPQGITALHTLPKGKAPPSAELLPPFAEKLKDLINRRHGTPHV